MIEDGSLSRETEALRERLREAEETLDAIRNGEVDAVVVAGDGGVPQVYTLETADQTYRILVEEMREGAVTLSADGTVLYSNRRFAELVGVNTSAIVGGLLSRYVSPNDIARLDAAAAQSGKGEFDLVSVNGLLVPVHFSFARLGGDERSPETFCCVVTDLTDQNRTGEELRSAHERLLLEVEERQRTEELLRHSLKMEAVGQLTGGVAHDFNNLLMAISGGLDMLKRTDDPVRRERIEIGMRQAVDRGAGLTRQLLTFSRRQAIDPEAIDIPRQIAGMRELLERSLRGDIQVVTDFAADLWPVYLDTNEFELVVMNLCINARDAMPNGGTITVSAKNKPSLKAGRFSGDFVQVIIADNGSGMTPEVLAHALEPFYTTKDVGKGSGLGLAQAYGFANSAGGKLDIKSEVGQGTSISLLFPRSDLSPNARTAEIGHAKTELDQGPGNGHVLLVEDDHEVAEFTAEMIRSSGYRVTRVASAQAALGALANGRNIDLVFSDIMMPGGMNGVDLAKEIRTRKYDVPVLLTSGYAAAFQAEAHALGVRILAKPYRMEELSAVLLELMQP
jgi:PAS domain S-box-containing protein